MLLTLLLTAVSAFSLSDCTPARWAPADPATLSLLAESPINCLVVEEPSWTPAFLESARKRGIRVLASLPPESPEPIAQKALAAGVDALYAETLASPESAAALEALAAKAGKPFVWLPERVRMPLNLEQGSTSRPVVGTWQGLWAGVKLGHEGEAEAAPSGPPWIDTNSGFLRFVRAITPPTQALWLANRPPAAQHVPLSRYLQAIGDAEMAGARWVLSFQDSFWSELVEGVPATIEAWRRVNAIARFYQQQRALTQLSDYSSLAIVQDVSSGALVSGSVLDMVESKHIPAMVIPPGFLSKAHDQPLKLLLNIDPQSLSDPEKEAVRGAARRGAMVINGPPQWKLALPPPEAIIFTDDQISQLDEIWKEINRVIGRENFAVRLFGAPAMLSNLKASADGKTLVLHLVNYSDYPVEAITVHTAEVFRKATLLTPRGEESPELYKHDDAVGIDIDSVEDVAILVLER
ncbi:MAG: hypothetical protein KIT83_01680 [Bryobacterales bacterium]|nr:hypothetical protein [Bryobacterales bacterium]